MCEFYPHKKLFPIKGQFCAEFEPAFCNGLSSAGMGRCGLKAGWSICVKQERETGSERTGGQGRLDRRNPGCFLEEREGVSRERAVGENGNPADGWPPRTWCKS